MGEIMDRCYAQIKAAEDFHIQTRECGTPPERVVHAYSPFDPPPREFVSGVTTQAYVNHGRWCVRCPWCRSSQNASRVDHRFFCCECGNAPVGGRWVYVLWPEDWEQVEDALARRPAVKTRNMELGETATDLNVENIEHGVH